MGKKQLLITVILLTAAFFICPVSGKCEKIGVLYVVHGGFDEFHPQHLWDASIQLFSYRPDHIVHKNFIWNSGEWQSILAAGNAPKEIGKYGFEYERLGGTDPFHALTDSQIAQLESRLNAASCPDVSFVVDYASWMAGDRVEHYAYPRFIYSPPEYLESGFLMPEARIADVTYCGEQETDDVVLAFNNGTAAFTEGAVLSGSASGATAEIDEVLVTSGSWTSGDAAGILSLSNLEYTSGTCARSGNVCSETSDCGFAESCLGNYFADGETITDSGAAAGSANAVGTTHWEGCDAQRYNVDGPAERFIQAGVDKIVVVDLTTGGVRFFKTFDVIQKIQLALEHNGVSIPVDWVNDPYNLMASSYPTDPIGYNGRYWTPDLNEPSVDPSVPLDSHPNPVAADTDLALLHVTGIEEGFSDTVADSDTGVLLLNHATRDYAQNFDPKIDDTLVLNENIKTLLLSRHPEMDSDNIIGAYMGVKEYGPTGVFERTREMRGENLGHAWLYEGNSQIAIDFKDGTAAFNVGSTITGQTSGAEAVVDQVILLNGTWSSGNAVGTLIVSSTDVGAFEKNEIISGGATPSGSATAASLTKWADTMPGDEWGYRYWDALEYLKNRGVGHIVIGFPQIVTDSVLNLVEIPNQIGKEIGIKTWQDWGVFDYAAYPGIGHPFADYWGVWVDTDCGGVPCCFEMGGCGDPSRPYPPPRQTTGARGDLDPSMAYDLSDYGHLGYDETGASGAPDPEGPVQNQYTGTWAMYSAPNDASELASIIANHVLETAGCPTIVDLADFSAQPGRNKITLTWKTASEIDTAGFNLYRSESEKGEYKKINEALIPSRGSSTEGAEYVFVDTQLKNRKRYYYTLEDIDINGTATRHGPVEARPGLFAGIR